MPTKRRPRTSPAPFAPGSTRAMAQRESDAAHKFIDYAMGHCDLTKQEAEHVLSVYLKLRLIKLDMVDGQFKVKHGAFLDCETMQETLRQYPMR